MNDIFFLYLKNKDTYAIIDSIWSDEVLKFKWRVQENKNVNYAYSDEQKIWLHRLVLKLNRKYQKTLKQIDHIDDNGLNNLDANLRYISHSENVRRAYRTNPLRNIWRKKNKYIETFQVAVSINNETISLGNFSTITEAQDARDNFYKRNNICQD